MSVRLFLLIPVLALLFGFLPATADCETIFRYKDANGNIAFTDDLNNIPAKYRKDAVLFTPPANSAKNSTPLPADQPAALPAIVLPPAAVGAVAMAEDYWKSSWVRGGVFFAGACAVFLGLLKLLEFIPSHNLGRFILLLFFLGTATFGYKLFVEKMLLNYAAAKEETTRTVNEVNKRQEGRLPSLSE